MTTTRKTTTRNLCGDYLLAILGPNGKPVVDSTRWKAGLAGAAIVGAVMDGSLRLTGAHEPGVREGRLVRTARSAPADPVRAEVLERVAGRKPKNAVARIGGGETVRDRAGALRDVVAADLQREEVVTREEHRVLGMFSSPRFLVVDPAAREAVLERVSAALEPGAELGEHDAALTSLLHASGALPKVLPSLDRRWVAKRGKAVSEGSWASTAVTRAIADVNAAVVAGVMAASIGSVAATG